MMNADGTLSVLEKTSNDHSLRAFAGFKHAFNTEVSLSNGVEYLQSFVHEQQYRVNYDALVSANIGAGLALGFGFTARYDHSPLPAKKPFDTSTTVSLMYAYSNVPPPAAEPPK